jgi:hypothetical protein
MDINVTSRCGSLWAEVKVEGDGVAFEFDLASPEECVTQAQRLLVAADELIGISLEMESKGVCTKS